MQPAGLVYISDYISTEETQNLLQVVDAHPWLSTFKRRVQHHGYVYDYKKRKIDDSLYLGALPAWAQALAERLHDDGHMAAVPDQVIVNEYVPGQGIALHVDCEPCFEDTIISLSLGSGCMMDFVHCETKQMHQLYLEARSLLVMQGEARYQWQHGIRARKSDVVQQKRCPRGRRVSLTLRKVIN